MGCTFCWLAVNHTLWNFINNYKLLTNCVCALFCSTLLVCYNCVHCYWLGTLGRKACAWVVAPIPRIVNPARNQPSVVSIGAATSLLRKLKNRKNGVGLGTRLPWVHINSCNEYMWPYMVMTWTPEDGYLRIAITTYENNHIKCQHISLLL